MRVIKATQRRERLREALAGNECVLPITVFDPISARIANELGFEFGQFVGSVASPALLAAPDLTGLTLTELADQTRRICRASSLVLMVEGDNGYGNALNVMRTVAELEHAGAASIKIDDVVLPQRFGSSNRMLRPAEYAMISLEEGVGKMKAALDAREDSSLVIVGCTFSGVIADIYEMVRRAKAYEQAGVDALKLGGARTMKEVVAVRSETTIPLILGNLRGDFSDLSILASNGVRIASHGPLAFQAAVKAVHDTLKALQGGVSPVELAPHLASPALLRQVTHQAHYSRLAEQYLT